MCRRRRRGRRSASRCRCWKRRRRKRRSETSAGGGRRVQCPFSEDGRRRRRHPRSPRWMGPWSEFPGDRFAATLRSDGPWAKTKESSIPGRTGRHQIGPGASGFGASPKAFLGRQGSDDRSAGTGCGSDLRVRSRTTSSNGGVQSRPLPSRTQSCPVQIRAARLRAPWRATIGLAAFDDQPVSTRTDRKACGRTVSRDLPPSTAPTLLFDRILQFLVEAHEGGIDDRKIPRWAPRRHSGRNDATEARA